MYEIDRSAFVTLTASVVLSGLVVLPSLYLPKRIVDQFANGGTFEAVIFYAAIFAALSLILGLLEQMTASKLEKQTKTLEYEGVIRLFQKIAEMDYDLLQSAETMDCFAKATKCVMAQNFYQLAVSLSRFFSSIWLLIVVTSTLLLLDPKILLIVGVVILINAFTNAKMNRIRYQIDGELWPLDRRMTWFMRFAGDLKYAKDVRSNEAQGFLFSKYRRLSHEFYRLQDKIVNSERNVKLINVVLTCVQELLIYFILGYNILVRRIFTVGDFSVVFNAMNAFKLKENLSLGDEAVTEERIWQAAERIGFLHFLKGLPKELDTMLYSDYDKEGIDLSGGEAQKTAILRALLRESNIVILDEPTAALDPLSEYHIYQMIDQFSGNKLMIYISHRLASSKFCDKILVFADGTLAEEGNHESLMARESRYKALFELQAQYYSD